MHALLRCILSLALISQITGAASPTPDKLTIVVDFLGPYSKSSIDEMKHEVEGILQRSGLTLNWQLRTEAKDAVYDNLVVVRFKGKCILEPVGYLYDERGPLAFTHSTDGSLLPFSEVACDQVTASIRPAIYGDYSRADLLLGRALGRVLAHELVHILTKSAGHGHEGIAKTALSASQLIADKLALHSDDLARLHPDRKR